MEDGIDLDLLQNVDFNLRAHHERIQACCFRCCNEYYMNTIWVKDGQRFLQNIGIFIFIIYKLYLFL